ncbi:MAG: recombinase family protein, partial [Acetatifactor muris]|nr:recombinase family protein [Acetatifactor muris]
KEGNVEIFLRLFGDLGLEKAVLEEDNYTADANASESEELNEPEKPGKVANGKSPTQADKITNRNALNNNNHT